MFCVSISVCFLSLVSFSCLYLSVLRRSSLSLLYFTCLSIFVYLPVYLYPSETFQLLALFEGFLFWGFRESTNGAEALRHLTKVREYEEKRGARVAFVVALLCSTVATWSGRMSWMVGIPAMSALIYIFSSSGIATENLSRPVESYTALKAIPNPGCFGEEISGRKVGKPADDVADGIGYRDTLSAVASITVGTLHNASTVSWRFLRDRIAPQTS